MVCRFFFSHISRLIPAWTGNLVVLTQHYRMFSPGGKANIKIALSVLFSETWLNLTAADKRIQGFKAKLSQ